MRPALESSQGRPHPFLPGEGAWGSRQVVRDL
jgi:hypothetical protein